jgi:type IV secretory pathway VirB10-like protein
MIEDENQINPEENTSEKPEMAERPSQAAGRSVSSEAYINPSAETVGQTASGPTESVPYQSTLRGSEPNTLVTGDIKARSLSAQLSKWPVVAGSTLLAIAMCTMLYNWVVPKPAFNGHASGDSQQKPGPGQPTQLLEGAPDTVVINQKMHLPQEDPLVPGSQSVQSKTAYMTQANGPPPVEPVDYKAQAQMQLQMQREQEAAQREAARLAKLQSAQDSNSTIFSMAQSPQGNQSSPRPNNNAGPWQDGNASDIQPAINENGAGPMLKGRLNALEGSQYLPNTRVPAISPYEVKAGTVIPSVMISGINSELPGQLVAQVVQNVYDTAKGHYLLIPQGAKLVGTYDHGVAVGQKRVLIVWNRIIYPDASSLDLGAMAGQVQSGYAGFKDKADNHVWPMFRNALLLSAITAGVQLSQPRAQKGDYSYSSQQMIAGSLGMQLNQLGLSTYQSRANMAPTLTIRPGYRFNVMVSKDLILPPWTTHSNVPPYPHLQTANGGNS